MDLLRSKKERDEAFTRFVRDATGSLSRTAWLLTGDRDRAAELVQAALVKTYVAWGRVRPDEALPYTRRILINAHTDHWRRGRRETSMPDAGFAGGGDDASEPRAADAGAWRIGAVDERDRVQRMLAGLPPRQRAVVVLRFLDDLSEAEVADALGITVGTVKSASSRALAALRLSYAPATTEGDPS